MKVEHSIDIEKVKYMKVIIIGGGAAGMMAALSAREQGADVTILERQARVGKKLLATGAARETLAGASYPIAAKEAIARTALKLAGEFFPVMK